MIRRLRTLVSGKNTLSSAATILVATTLLSNVLGLLRDRFFAQKVPIDLLDTYFAAFRIPDFVFNLIILGTVSAAFIPVFLEYRAKGERESWRVAHAALTLGLLVLLGLAAVLFLLAPTLVPLIVPDFSPDKQILTVELTRILLLQPIFFGLSYLFSGILNALKRFFVYAIAPLVYNLAIIGATVLFADEFGVQALVWGVAVGAFLHMFIQFLTAQTVGFRWAFSLDFAQPAIRKIVRLMLPRSIGLAAYQGMLLVFTAIASSLGVGAVAAYNFADNIQTMPVAVFGLSFVTALYPTLAEKVAGKKLAEFADLVWRSTRYLLVVMVPSAIGIFLIRAQLVRLILGTGYFGWEATITTAQTLGAFLIAMIFAALAALLARSFWALHDTKTPTVIQVVSYVGAILLALWLAPARGVGLGVPGLALAFGIGSVVAVGLSYWQLRQRVPHLRGYEAEWLPLIGQLIVGLIALTMVVQLAKFGVAELVDMERFWGVFVQALVATGLGAGSYWLVMSWQGVPEIATIRSILVRRLLGRATPIEAQPPVRS
ncbi:murein biosynthesis integral membrane protein MurJ [Candidatus Berkelbacteria bacterium]|nr:murein biosynthesis integral membrane protein MurJ [Candidatus Berkelbacteria bacterium]